MDVQWEATFSNFNSKIQNGIVYTSVYRKPDQNSAYWTHHRFLNAMKETS
jgi:hypothetical protein